MMMVITTADVSCLVVERIRVAVAVTTVVTVEVSGRRIAAIAAVVVRGQVNGAVQIGRVVERGVVCLVVVVVACARV
jgi:hypothetical protein